MSLPTEAAARKLVPLATGLLDYFPAALVAVAELSRIGNDQHNPGAPLHWDRSKSVDDADALMRHFLERGKTDTDGVRHTVKVAWRALALLQKELEARKLALSPPQIENYKTVVCEPRPDFICLDCGVSIDSQALVSCRYQSRHRYNSLHPVHVGPH